MLLVGCGEVRTTELGIEVEIEPGAGYPGDRWVDRTWQIVHGAIGDHYGDPSGLTVVYTADDLRSVGENISGYHDNGRLVVHRTSDWTCRPDALAHEMVHANKWLNGFDQDGDHVTHQFVDTLPRVLELLEGVCQ